MGFPLLVEPWSKTPCLIIVAMHVENAIPGFPPTMIECLGLSKSGQQYKFIVPITEYQAAARNPVTLHEAEGITAPSCRLTLPSLPNAA